MILVSLGTIDLLPTFGPLSGSGAYRHVDYDEVWAKRQFIVVNSIRVSGR